MGRAVVHHQRTRGDRELRRHRQQLPPMVELVGDDLGDLADRQLFVVAAVEYFSHRRLRLIDREQQRVREIVDIAERDEAESGVGQEEKGAAIEHASADAPRTRCELTRSVDVRIPEVGGGGVRVEEQSLGASDAVALAALRLGRQISVLAGRYGEPRGHMYRGVEEASIDRNTTD